MKKLALLFLFGSLSITLLQAQLRLDTLGWIPPVDIPLFLSGNFAELRSGHFHGGLDIKTQGKEGAKVYAVQDGYVSRIKVSPIGYGNALYVTHPDGYTSVYGHLKGYNIQIEKYVRARQYNKKSFAVDLYPTKGELKVSQGDVVALSGNTGSSGGPHVHFEVRDTRNSHPLNGLFLGYKIEDNIAPKMFQLYAYSKDINGINSYKNRSVYALKKIGANYKLAQGDTLKVDSEFGLGVKVNDYLNKSYNKCGIYQLKMYVDGVLYFKSQFDGFSFPESRYINSLHDYGEAQRIGRYLHKMYIEPNNHLSVYCESVNNGIVKLDHVAKIKIVAVDAYFNKSNLVFYVNPVKQTKTRNLTKDEVLMHYDQAYSFDTLGLKLSLVKNSLYEDLAFKLKVNQYKTKSSYSNTYSIHNRYTPVHKNFSISIACDSVSPKYESKLLLARKVRKYWVSAGGYFKNGVVKGESRTFGTYRIMIDTVPPKIYPLGVLKTEKGLIGTQTLTFKITDNFSGIAKYTGTINGKWVLFQWDKKTRRIFYQPDEYLPLTGTFTIKLIVVDAKGNSTIFSRKYTRNAPYTNYK